MKNVKIKTNLLNILKVPKPSKPAVTGQSKPDWQWRWYGGAFGPGEVKIAIVWNDRPAPELRIGEEMLVLTTGSSESALQEYADKHDLFIRTKPANET